MNHLHIDDLRCNATASEAQLRFLGRSLAEIYAVKLRSDFPGLGFAVSVRDEPGLELPDYQLTFWPVE